ncbi:hypothetical protein Hanom_Chr08g00717961 [Helianthus anomalus]
MRKLPGDFAGLVAALKIVNLVLLVENFTGLIEMQQVLFSITKFGYGFDCRHEEDECGVIKVRATIFFQNFDIFI